MSKERLIAVIGDDGPFRAGLVELLSSTRFGARGFSSAEEFLASHDGYLYDCIIADIHMPTDVICLLGKPFGPDALIACLEKALTA